MYRGKNHFPVENIINQSNDHDNSPTLSFIEIIVYNETIRLCIDSASTLSLVRSDIFQKFKLNMDVKNRCEIKVANGQTTKTLGMCKINLSLPGNLSKLQVDFSVVDNLPVPMILGLNILKKCVLDYPRKMLVHAERKISCPMILETPCINTCDFISFNDDKATLSDFKKQQLKLNYKNPILYDTNTDKFFPINKHGEITISSDITEIETDFELSGPVLEGKAEMAMAILHQHEIMNEKLCSVKKIDQLDINPNLPLNVRNKYINLLTEFQDLFIYSMSDIGKYQGPEKYTISLTTERPQKSATYPIPLHLQENFRNHINDLLKNGLIEPCESTLYNHGFLAVPKKDKTVRWASDMRALNSVTEEDPYSLPLLQPMLQKMIGNKVYSSCDVFACFHQFPVNESDRDYFAFTDPLTGIRYRWKVCYFGLKNIPAFVSYIMANQVFRMKDSKECNCYIDDVSCYNKTHSHMLDNLRDVFERVRHFGLKFKGSKCKFGYDYLSQFGYLVNEKGMTIDPERASKLQNIELPKTRKQLHTALGGMGYFRDVVPNFAKFSSILTPMLSDKYSFVWLEDQKTAWDNLLQAVKNAILLSKPNLQQRMIITSDASDRYHGAVLSQEYDGKKHLLAVYSAHLAQNVINWSINVKELLGCVKACEKFENELIGKKFLLRTDSAWVYFLLSKAKNIYYKKAGPVVRLLMRLSKFSFDIEHVRGDNYKMQLADLCSRLNVDRITLSHKTVGELLTPCAEFGDISMVIIPQFFSRDYIRKTVKESQNKYLASIIKKYSKRKGFNRETLELQGKLIVPEKCIAKLLRMVHHHHGMKRELGMIRACDLRWDSMSQDVFDYVRSCEQCSRMRKVNKGTADYVFPKAPTRPFESVAIDILQVNQGAAAVYILGLIDHLTGFVLLEQVPSLSIESSLDQLISWILIYNITECSIRSDNQFNKNEFIEMMNLINCYPRFGCPANSTSNSEIERKFRSVNECFRAYQLASQGMDKIKITLSFVQAHLNATPMGDLTICPYECIWGYTPKLYLLEPLPNHTVDNLQSYARIQYDKFLSLSKHMEHHYDRMAGQRVKDQTKVKDLYKVGDKVRIRKQPTAGANKLQTYLYSADVFEIKEVRVPTRSYLIELIRYNRQPLRILAHHRRCKKVLDRPVRLQECNAEQDNNEINIRANQPVVAEQQETSHPVNTRTKSGRNIRTPRHLKDYQT